MSKVCAITGKITQVGSKVSHANNKTKRKLYINLQEKRFYIPEQKIWINIRLSTAALRQINKNGLIPVLKKAKQKGTLAQELVSLIPA